MSVELRWEQGCETTGSTKPARYGALCFACFQAAGPARRSVELLAAPPAPQTAPLREHGYVSDDGAEWLKRLWARRRLRRASRESCGMLKRECLVDRAISRPARRHSAAKTPGEAIAGATPAPPAT